VPTYFDRFNLFCRHGRVGKFFEYDGRQKNRWSFYYIGSQLRGTRRVWLAALEDVTTSGYSSAPANRDGKGTDGLHISKEAGPVFEKEPGADQSWFQIHGDFTALSSARECTDDQEQTEQMIISG